MTSLRTILPLSVSIALLMAGCAGQTKDNPPRVQTVQTITEFMQTGDTTNLRPAFADSLLEELSLEGMVAVRGDMIEKYGTLREVSAPEFDSASHALVFLTYEQAVLDVTLTLDSDDKVALVSISISPTWVATTDSSVRNSDSPITVLDSVGQFARQFDADTNYVRLVALLSPT